MHKNKRVLVPIVLVVLLAAAGLAWLFRQGKTALAGGSFEASGTVEAVQIAISPETRGRVRDVLAEKGQQVQAGEPLIRLDDTLLQAQRQRAEAARRAAEANLTATQSALEQAQAALMLAEANLHAAQANAQAERIVAQQSLDALYENAQLARTEAERAVAAANQALRDATYQYDNFTPPSNQKKFTPEQGVLEMKKQLDAARARFEPYRYESENDPTREDMKELLDEAQADYDSAVKRLQYVTALKQAEARLEKAAQDLEKVQDGPDPDAVEALEARLAAIQTAPEQALAAVEQAKTGVKQARDRLEQAKAALAQAESELNLVQAQIDKLVVYAPASGIVLSRSVEPGEVILAGASALSLAQLDQPTITVYVPEDRYGQIKLGDQAVVTVDSFPGEKFKADVVYIASQAEFTPRNVQTAEGRRTTVFAVELAVDNPEQKLKPGMPADVCFGCR